MDPNTELKILALLTNRHNPWWSSQTLQNIPQFQRADFKRLKLELEGTKIVTVIGPRQVGKTTIVKQLISTKLSEGVAPKRILYAQLDDVELRILSGTPLIDLVNTYEKNVLQENLSRIQEPVYFFFDEIQRADSWAEYLKGIRDSSPNVKMFVTGSASFTISQQGKETLPGRQLLYTVFPLKFVDACLLKDASDKSQVFSSFKSNAYALRASLVEAMEKKKPDIFFEEAKKILVDETRNKIEIDAAVRQYLLRGGYPEIVQTPDFEKCQRLLQGYANDVIVKDLMPWFKIRDFPTAEKLLFLLAAASGEKLNVTELLKRISGSNQITVNKYIDYFEQLNILGKLSGYSGSRFGSAKHPKIYFYDPGLQNALLGRLGAKLVPDEEGHMAETAAHDHLRRLLFKLNDGVVPKMGYYVSDGKEKEIDFLIGFRKYDFNLPVEVKFRKRVEKSDLSGLYEYKETNNPRMSLVLTSDTLDYRDDIIFMPLWEFLMMA